MAGGNINSNPPLLLGPSCVAHSALARALVGPWLRGCSGVGEAAVVRSLSSSQEMLRERDVYVEDRTGLVSSPQPPRGRVCLWLALFLLYFLSVPVLSISITSLMVYYYPDGFPGPKTLV